MSPFTLGAGNARPDPSAAARVRAWVERVLGDPDDVTVSITQLSCREPGCPPLETCIGLLRHHGPSTAVTIHRAVADLTEEEVTRTVRAALWAREPRPE